jgi:hypothetical protein
VTWRNQIRANPSQSEPIRANPVHIIYEGCTFRSRFILRPRPLYQFNLLCAILLSPSIDTRNGVTEFRSDKATRLANPLECECESTNRRSAFSSLVRIIFSFSKSMANDFANFAGGQVAPPRLYSTCSATLIKRANTHT